MCWYYYIEKLPHTGEFSFDKSLLLIKEMKVIDFWPYLCLIFQWMERKADGGVVFRSARAEEKEARRYNSHKQKTMEALFAKIHGEFEKEEKGRSFSIFHLWNPNSY